LAIPSRPLPAFLNPEVPAAAAPAVPAVPQAAPAVAGRRKVNKARPFSAEDLEAGYQRQIAGEQLRTSSNWPDWLSRLAALPVQQQGGNGLLPTLPPGNQFPLLTQLTSGL
jgi:hypothetical protein